MTEAIAAEGRLPAAEADVLGRDSIAAPLVRVEAELAAFAGDARRAVDACAALIDACDEDVAAAGAVYERLGRLLSFSRNRAAAAAVHERLEQRIRTPGAPAALYHALLQVRERPLRMRAVAALRAAVAAGFVPAVELLAQLAGAVADIQEELPDLAGILASVAGASGVPALLDPGQPPALRELAARVLDETGELPARDRWTRALGAPAAARLAAFLAFTRASHRDLLRLMPAGDGQVPLLDSVDAAERALGAERLARVIAELGWSRVALGLEVMTLVTVRIGGGFPVLVRPAEVALLEECGGVERIRESTIVLAHGALETTECGPGAAAHAETIRRFRDYNVVHAELLNEILEVAPVTAGKARRIIGRIERIAADFAALFAEYDDEAAHAPEAARRLAERIGATLPAADDALLGAEPLRLVQAFEEPVSLNGVTTVHGMKRYLHQRGLRNAFRLFHAGATANRSVDLVLLGEGAAQHVLQRIRYIEFEPRPGAVGLPPIVRLVVDSYQRWLAHGLRRFPDTRLLIYAHEVQLYLSFRAHPAFVRFDLSPPRRGGMIDLEYFAVSQNELAQHPALQLPAMQAFLRRMGFYVALDGLRIHARYDKERAFDRADILEKAAALLRLAPLLMDLDWTIGVLAYSRDARGAVQDAWSDLFAREGVLPVDALLTADRTRVLAGYDGDREIGWDGVGPYPARFTPVSGETWWPRLHAVLHRHDLAGIARTEHAGTTPPWQRELERSVLRPLRDALASGEVAEYDGALRAAPRDRFRRVHEAARLALLLEEGGTPLREAARLAAVLRNASGQFRVRVTGTINGYPVQRADVALSDGPVALSALCDGHGTPQLAFGVTGASPCQRRDAPDGEWRWHGEPGAARILEQLLRDNYLAPAPELLPHTTPGVAELRALFAQPALRPPRPALPGDRVVAAESAAPGRAAGVARLGADRPARISSRARSWLHP
jgi:hypothetical protein